jgi:hypothetical protein
LIPLASNDPTARADEEGEHKERRGAILEHAKSTPGPVDAARRRRRRRRRWWWLRRRGQLEQRRELGPGDEPPGPRGQDPRGELRVRRPPREPRPWGARDALGWPGPPRRGLPRDDPGDPRGPLGRHLAPAGLPPRDPLPPQRLLQTQQRPGDHEAFERGLPFGCEQWRQHRGSAILRVPLRQVAHDQQHLTLRQPGAARPAGRQDPEGARGRGARVRDGLIIRRTWTLRRRSRENRSVNEKLSGTARACTYLCQLFPQFFNRAALLKLLNKAGSFRPLAQRFIFPLDCLIQPLLTVPPTLFYRPSSYHIYN